MAIFSRLSRKIKQRLEEGKLLKDLEKDARLKFEIKNIDNLTKSRLRQIIVNGAKTPLEKKRKKLAQQALAKVLETEALSKVSGKTSLQKAEDRRKVKMKIKREAISAAKKGGTLTLKGLKVLGKELRKAGERAQQYNEYQKKLEKEKEKMSRKKKTKTIKKKYSKKKTSRYVY